MTETLRIGYQGSGPFLRTLVRALEGDGVEIAVRRDGPSAGQHRKVQGMGGAVTAALVVTGATAATRAAVATFRQQFPDHALVVIEDEDTPPHTSGRPRA